MFQPLLSLAVIAPASIILGLPISAILLSRRISESASLVPPTSAILDEENPTSNCALFRHLPKLANYLAWSLLLVLGCCKMPVRICHVPPPHEGEGSKEIELKFLVKREDLFHPSMGFTKFSRFSISLQYINCAGGKGVNRASNNWFL